MHLCEQVDDWFVLRTRQNGEFLCLFCPEDEAG